MSYNFIDRVHNSEDWVLTSRYAYHKSWNWRTLGHGSHIIVRVERSVYDACLSCGCLDGLENDLDYATIVAFYEITADGALRMLRSCNV